MVCPSCTYRELSASRSEERFSRNAETYPLSPPAPLPICLPCGGSIRRTSDGKREEHREIPWCAHHAPTESFPHQDRKSGSAGMPRPTPSPPPPLFRSVCPAVEAFVERATESAKSIGRFHGVPIMHLPRAFRIKIGRAVQQECRDLPPLPPRPSSDLSALRWKHS